MPPLFHGNRGLYVTSHRLARHLREIKDSGLAPFTTLGEWNRERPTGRRIAVTFDDAYENLFTNGLPILKELGVPAITYVVASLIGNSNEWDHHTRVRRTGLMNREQLMEWLQAGHEIGSHGLTHRDLTTLPPDEARREIVESKQRLEERFGQPVRHFCYPYGAWNDSVRAMVQEAGYETATSTISGTNSATTDAFTIRRILARHQRPWLAALTRR